jgi:predicted deacylase
VSIAALEARTAPVALAPLRVERVLGTYDTGHAGPTIVVTAGIHGNEPAGVHALRRVFRELEARRPPGRGRLVGLAGNRAALARDTRYVSRDLNRGWTPERVAALLAGAGDATPGAVSEDVEQHELLRQLLEVLATSSEPVTFLDLHSTSAGGAPFCVISDTLRNRRLAFALPVPVILGLEEALEGTLTTWLDDLGHVAVAFEGGQNADPRTVERHEAALWLTLVTSGFLQADAAPELPALRERLRAAAGGIPRILDVRHREAVAPEDDFSMRPGYVSFQPVRRGEPLAANRRGPILAPFDGLLLMPLYQKQGADGFFLARPVRRIWLRVSALLRQLRLHVLLPVLPGVARSASNPDQLWVDPRVARFLVVEVFHLLGFRRMKSPDRRLRFARRRPGFRRLAPLPTRAGASGEGAA